MIWIDFSRPSTWILIASVIFAALAAVGSVGVRAFFLKMKEILLMTPWIIYLAYTSENSKHVLSSLTWSGEPWEYAEHPVFHISRVLPAIGLAAFLTPSFVWIGMRRSETIKGTALVLPHFLAGLIILANHVRSQIFWKRMNEANPYGIEPASVQGIPTLATIAPLLALVLLVYGVVRAANAN